MEASSADAKFWLSKKGALQRADEEMLSKQDRKAFEEYRYGLKKWMLSPAYETLAEQRGPRQTPKTGQKWVSYDLRFPCPCDPKDGRHDWQSCGSSDGDGDGDRCSQCGTFSMNGGYNM